MKTRFLLIDGHSIIFAWTELRALHQRRPILAREELVKRLTRYGDAVDTKVVFVFDGQGVSVSEELAPEGAQIFYSASDRTADEIIERLAAKYAEKCDLTVATNDHLEQQTVSSFGAMPISADHLRSLVEAAEHDFEQELKKYRGK